MFWQDGDTACELAGSIPLRDTATQQAPETARETNGLNHTRLTPPARAFSGRYTQQCQAYGTIQTLRDHTDPSTQCQPCRLRSSTTLNPAQTIPHCQLQGKAFLTLRLTDTAAGQSMTDTAARHSMTDTGKAVLTLLQGKVVLTLLQGKALLTLRLTVNRSASTSIASHSQKTQHVQTRQ